MEKAAQGRMFTIMECSHKKGGKLWPHNTHQNGLSIDFMMPLERGGVPCYELDTKGLKHYLLDFDDNGKYEKDKSIQVNFEVLARHLLSLDVSARARGYRVKKVIIKVEFKDELYATFSGRKLREKGVYLVKALTPKINKLHDDHYHVDFEKL
jgi:penicillin-insensitive murein endopeptidase